MGWGRIRSVLSGGAIGPPQGRTSAQADLAEDALAGEQFGGEADHEAEHGQTAIPGLSEGNKTEAGGGGVSHWSSLVTKLEATVKHREQGCLCPSMPIRALSGTDFRDLLRWLAGTA